jgi:hypothetical protein
LSDLYKPDKFKPKTARQKRVEKRQQEVLQAWKRDQERLRDIAHGKEPMGEPKTILPWEPDPMEQVIKVPREQRAALWDKIAPKN